VPYGDAESPTDAAGLRQRVQKVLAAFLAQQGPVLDLVSEELGPLSDAATEFLLDGGKRLRPAFCYWGYRGAGGSDGDAVVAAAAALELLHACALIHDDVMDDSDTRRGRAAMHRRFAAVHRAEEWRGDPEAFGRSAAILLGDLCLSWADQLYNTSGMPADALLRGQGTYDGMRVELMAGQYLDLLEQALGGGTVQRALTVARFKSAKYTVERPLHLGAALAGGEDPAAGAALSASYSAFGLPLGEAFQLRDDVLGVFGDPAVTGKPAGDDLREGKRTALVATALERATPAQAAVVRRHLGDPHLTDAGVGALRTVVTETGALAAVETLIEGLMQQALAALQDAPITEEAREVLGSLAVAATTRTG
jgi:geranylgeranyl diphosphate synthase type I